jgi:hypothetical protein
MPSDAESGNEINHFERHWPNHTTAPPDLLKNLYLRRYRLIIAHFASAFWDKKEQHVYC